MSYVGNIIAAVGAYKVGKYNKELYDRQAALNREKAAERKRVYERIEKPRLLKAQKSQYSDFFVNLLRSGAEFRLGTSTFYAAQAFKVEQATDLAIADYNQSTEQIDMENQSLLLEARGDQAYMQGLLTAASEGAKAKSNYDKSQQA
tara:strand:- start:7742 stop:8182 length:441 start_codon:yes stop_codon:yes gene_type:complete